MIHALCDNGKTMIHVEGSMPDILSDLTIIVKAIYDELEDEVSKDIFKGFVEKLLPTLSFVKDEEIEKAVDKEIDKKRSELFDSIMDGNELIKKLDEILGMLKK